MTTRAAATQDLARKGEEAFNSHDSKAFAALYASDCVVTDPQYEQPLSGRNAVEKDIRDFFTAFPDIAIALRGVITDGDTLVAEWTASGTHNGPLSAPDGSLIPASGKPVKMAMALVGRVDGDGLIAEERRYFDLAGVLAQIGALPGA